MSKISLGLANKNPLNIRFSPMNTWKGQIGSRKGFCVFDSFEHGFRAAFVLLHNYIRRDYDTVFEIVSRWAPASENDTKSYIRYVVDHLRIVDGDTFSRVTSDTIFPSYGSRECAYSIAWLAFVMCCFECGLSSSGKADVYSALRDYCWKAFEDWHFELFHDNKYCKPELCVTLP